MKDFNESKEVNSDSSLLFNEFKERREKYSFLGSIYLVVPETDRAHFLLLYFTSSKIRDKTCSTSFCTKFYKHENDMKNTWNLFQF